MKLPDDQIPPGNAEAGRVPRVAGVVVLYHPGGELAANISSYLDDVEVLFAIDNSEEGADRTSEMLQGLAGVVFIANGENLGVARALNMGAQLALERGIDYLLTMDQDSRANPGMVRSMLFSLANRELDNVGIMAPDLVTKPEDIAPTAGICREVGTVMTSGSLLDLRAYLKAGPFLDGLFIDFVDIEYCLRLRAAGFRIMRGGGAVLEHRVGEIITIPLGARGFHLTSHSPLRKYYKTRNRFYVADRYGDVFPFFRFRDMARFLLELVRLLIFEEGKMEKLRMMGKGYRDYRKGRLGKYDSGESFP